MALTGVESIDQVVAHFFSLESIKTKYLQYLDNYNRPSILGFFDYLKQQTGSSFSFETYCSSNGNLNISIISNNNDNSNQTKQENQVNTVLSQLGQLAVELDNQSKNYTIPTVSDATKQDCTTKASYYSVIGIERVNQTQVVSLLSQQTSYSQQIDLTFPEKSFIIFSSANILLIDKKSFIEASLNDRLNSLSDKVALNPLTGKIILNKQWQNLKSLQESFDGVAIQISAKFFSNPLSPIALCFGNIDLNIHSNDSQSWSSLLFSLKDVLSTINSSTDWVPFFINIHFLFIFLFLGKIRN